MDARGLPQDADSPNRPARPLRDRRPAPRGQLDHPGADAGEEGDPPREGAGRGRARALPLLRRRDAGGQPRRTHGAAARRQDEVFVDFQLSDADLGRHGSGRLAGGRRGDHEPGAAAADLVRALQPRDGPDLQGGVVPPTAGLRHHDEDVRWHAGTEGDGAGCAESPLVSLPDDVRAVRQGLGALRPVDGLEDQNEHQRRATAEVRRPDSAAGKVPRPDRPRPRAEDGTRRRAATISRSPTGPSSTTCWPATAPATRTGSAPG